MKKRIGNDFQMLWIITENGETVDISTVTDFALSVHLSSSIYFTPDYVISEGSPLVQITKEQINELGTYYFLATWRVEDANYADGYRDVTADVTTFEIVPKSAQEEDVTDTITSEVALGYRGNGIESIDLTNTVGLVKTYTITYTDGTTTTFDVTDGADGHSPVITFVGTTIYVDGVAGADLKGDTGASAYEIYLAETTDDPPMTINEWGNLMTGILNVLNSI